MSADLLRRAATILRERAEDASPAPWTAGGNAVRTSGRSALALTYPIGRDEDRDQTRKDASYIATMHPDVGLALADWLALVARLLDEGFDPNAETDAALAIARLIVGES